MIKWKCIYDNDNLLFLFPTLVQPSRLCISVYCISASFRMRSRLSLHVKVKISINIQWRKMMQTYNFMYDSFLPCVPRPWPGLRWRRTGQWAPGSRWPPASPWGCSLLAAPSAGSAVGDPALTLHRDEGGFNGWGEESQDKKQEENVSRIVLVKEESQTAQYLY